MTDLEARLQAIEEAAFAKLEELVLGITTSAQASKAPTLAQIAESITFEGTVSPQYADKDDAFDGWLPLTAAANSLVRMNEAELMVVRDAMRKLALGNEICKNILHHLKNHVVGAGLRFTLVPIGEDMTPEELANQTLPKDAKDMMSRWRKFTKKNKFNRKARNWVERAHRDGEAFPRLIKGKNSDIPSLRFIDPFYIGGTDQDDFMGVKFDGSQDECDVVSYTLRSTYIASDKVPGAPKVDTQKQTIPAEEMIHDKRNVDTDVRRGLSSFWAVAPALRRLEKLFLNVSVLAQIKAAIAFVRKHKQVSQPQVGSMLKQNSDGSRIDAGTGREVRTKKFTAGTILDSSNATDYEFPAHNVDMAGFAEAALMDLARVANAFALPVEWLLSKEPTEPLGHGSPTIKMFQAEQACFYEHVEDLFWRVQAMADVNVEAMQEKYELRITGPALALGKVADQAKVVSILVQNGAISPQTISDIYGLDYRVERAQMIAHRNSRQPGEVMPGDAGNTNPDNPAKNDGSTKKDGTPKDNNGGGANNT